MPYGIPYTDKERMTRHQTLYGNTNIPSIRKRDVNIQNTGNSGAYLIGGIIITGVILYMVSKR